MRSGRGSRRNTNKREDSKARRKHNTNTLENDAESLFKGVATAFELFAPSRFQCLSLPTACRERQFSSSECRNPYSGAICLHGHRAILIGPVDRRPDVPVPLQYAQHRVAERVPASCADDGNVGPQRVEKRLRARRSAPVVRHLQDANGRAGKRRRDNALHFPADVAGEDERHAAVANLEYR